MRAMAYCEECLEKLRAIDRLKEEITLLKVKLRYEERKGTEGYFGASTPSSKKPVKANSIDEQQKKIGGARPGHKGHGRSTVQVEVADRVQNVEAEKRCPDCGGEMKRKGTKLRTVIDCQPVQMEKIVFQLERRRCPHCARNVIARPPGVFPKCLYGNQLLTHVAVQHYVYGVTLGQLEKQTGVGYGSLIDAMHQLARRLGGIPEKLVEEYRSAPVRHADETGWRTDGHNGYAWLFATPNIRLYRFRKTRSAAVPKEVFGAQALPGVLVVDRYAAYNRMPCYLQYCYSHLLRDVQGLEKEFPDNAEVAAFVQQLAPLLASAIALRSLSLSKREFKRQAKSLKSRIIKTTHRQAKHPGIQKIQILFREKAERLYHWVDDSSIPAENNLAERELRPLVVARKISFGSQSDAGARTREIIMTVLHTIKTRTSDVTSALKNFLDKYAEDPTIDPFQALFQADSS